MLSKIAAIAVCLLAVPTFAQEGSNTKLAAINGLLPLATLEASPDGRAALDANFKVTIAIQNGSAKQPTLQAWPEAQQLALRDAYITRTNVNQLADGLGTRLGDAYQAATKCTDKGDGKDAQCLDASPAIAKLIGYAIASAQADSNAAKFFFANQTTDGKEPVSADARQLLIAAGGTGDVFGRAYKLVAGTAGADPYGNSRPFQIEPHYMQFAGANFLGAPSGNGAYLFGPSQDLTASPSFPSGHTTYGYMGSMILAFLVPDRYSQMITRAAEYGNNRIILGAHYAMDVLGGRTLALYDLAQLLANKPNYVGKQRGKFEIEDFRAAVVDARAEFDKAILNACGGSVRACVSQDKSRFADPKKNETFYELTQTYGLGVVFKRSVDDAKEDVAKLAPEAGYLLTIAYPDLTLAQADQILTDTEGPGGGFLDNGSAFGVYSRLDLYKASLKAAAVHRH